VKTLLVTLLLCSVASAKVKPVPNYQDATFQETHAETVRINCYGTGYGSSMSTCHNAQVLVYTVELGPVVYTVTPYGTRPQRESLWKQPAGSVKVWNDGKHMHIRIGGRESQYDVINETVIDAQN
jgi:hypothetical protein